MSELEFAEPQNIPDAVVAWSGPGFLAMNRIDRWLSHVDLTAGSVRRLLDFEETKQPAFVVADGNTLYVAFVDHPMRVYDISHLITDGTSN